MQNKAFTMIFLGALFLLGCKNNPVTSIELANQFNEENTQHSSVSYDIDYQIKFFNQIQDTTIVNAKVDLIRETNDSIFGGHIWVTADSVSTYYNREALYSINHATHKIIKFPKEKTSPLTGTIIGDVYKTYFLKPERLLRGVTDSAVTVTISEERISSRDTWKVNYDIEGNKDVTDLWKNIWIDKENFVVIKINYHAESQGEHQYNQWDLFNVSFDSITVDYLENRLKRFLEEYEVEEYKEEPKKGLPNGTRMPNLEGIIYSDKSSAKMDDFLDKLTLYDFWYMDCPPCIKAIPLLNELHMKYGDKGLKLVGVNPFNYNEKDLNRMPGFLTRNNIEYPILFVDRDSIGLFQIPAYPTFYLVDHEGNILHSEIGFNEDKAKSLDSQLEDYLIK